MSSPFAKFPSILRASAGVTIFTSGPFFLYLLSVALERRPEEARDIVGRWRAVAIANDPSMSSSSSSSSLLSSSPSSPTSSTPTPSSSWRLRFNSMNMASVESPDGLAIRGRASYDQDKKGLTILPIWGETGRYFGFGFRPVRVEVAQWPRRPVSAGGGGELDAEAIEKDLFVVSSISTVIEEGKEKDKEDTNKKNTTSTVGENDLKEKCGIIAFMREV